jgi:hypothetical protein
VGNTLQYSALPRIVNPKKITMSSAASKQTTPKVKHPYSMSHLLFSVLGLMLLIWLLYQVGFMIYAYLYGIENANDTLMTWLQQLIEQPTSTFSQHTQQKLFTAIEALKHHSQQIINLFFTWLEDIGLININDDKATHIANTLYQWLQLSLLIILLVALKTGLLLNTLPALLLLSTLAITEGWVQRHLRRLHTERETALLFHKNLKWCWLSLLGSWGLILTLPTNMMTTTPITLLLYSAIALLLTNTIKHFKKYT